MVEMHALEYLCRARRRRSARRCAGLSWLSNSNSGVCPSRCSSASVKLGTEGRHIELVDEAHLRVHGQLELGLVRGSILLGQLGDVGQIRFADQHPRTGKLVGIESIGKPRASPASPGESRAGCWSGCHSVRCHRRNSDTICRPCRATHPHRASQGLQTEW